MDKIEIGPKALIPVMPTFIVGANVGNQPNFMTATLGGIANAEPPMISVALRHQRYTLLGIKQNMSFSINIPSIDIVEQTDYCGIVSGSNVNKTEACKFNVFYGKLNNAPLIDQCPINIECKVVQILNLDSHALVIGRVAETHVSKTCLVNGKPSINKIQPLSYTKPPAKENETGGNYRAIGEVIAKAYSIGHKLDVK